MTDLAEQRKRKSTFNNKSQSIFAAESWKTLGIGVTSYHRWFWGIGMGL